VRVYPYPFQLPKTISYNMSNTCAQNQGATREQRPWSTTATHGSDDQTRSNIHDPSAIGTNKNRFGAEAPFAIQCWLAEKPHEGPWNGMFVSGKLGEQASKRN
jgi:hypothetical protein